MMYTNYTRAAIRQEKADAKLFESVGLPWLAKIASRKASRLSATLRRKAATSTSNSRRVTA